LHQSAAFSLRDRHSAIKIRFPIRECDWSLGQSKTCQTSR
jgi:hypothetical protein